MKAEYKSSRILVVDVILIALLADLLLVFQIVFASLPNIELVSLLIILYTLHMKRKTLFIIYLFALLEGLVYGFGLWWIMYLYVWTVLYLLTRLFSGQTSVIFWSILSALFGLSFGALCSIPYLFIGGIGMAVSSFVAGIPFDLLHCVGNFAVCLVLFKPFHRLFTLTLQKIRHVK